MIKSFKERLSLIYLGLVMVIAIIGVTASVNLFNLARSINGLMIANYKSIKVIDNMTEYLQRQDHAALVTTRFAGNNQDFDFRDNQQLFQKAFQIEKNNITESGEEELVRRLGENYTAYLKTYATLRQVKNKGGIDPAYSFYRSTMVPSSEQVKAILKRLAVLNERAMFRSKERATVNAKRSMRIILMISLIAVLGGFVVSRFFMNRFLRPIDRLKETVKLVKAGDLHQQAKVYHPDEIGELATEFNNMTHQLLQYQQSTIGRLMAEKNKTLTIVKSISEPLIVLDADFRLLLINSAAEEIFAIEETKAVNRHFLEVIRNNELFDLITGATHSETDEEKQKIVLLRSQGKDYYFNVLVKLATDNVTAANTLIVLFQNITHLKQLEKVKADFIATVSHEFKTPLTSIMMGLSLLQEGKIGPLNDKQNQTLVSIQEEGDTLSNLVNDLLEMSKIDSGKSILKIQPCSIDGLIETAVKKFLELAQTKDVNLCYDADENLPKVAADPDRILWVLNNLIGNALKYTNAGDAIRVSAFEKHRKICVIVQDSGMGIPTEYQDKLFDKFVQVKGYDVEVRGTGLGLSIAKEIIEAHGGEIWYESEMDAGSTFTFTLPLIGEM